MNVQDIINEISSRIESIENDFYFTNKTGSIQVQDKGEQKHRFYGQFEALVSLYEDLTDTTWITANKPKIFTKPNN